MNCKNIEPLLSLYVGRDLEERLLQLVETHLQSCAECTLAADEYAGARDLLRRYDPPFCGDEIYAGIRQQVLNEIGRKSHAPLGPSSFSQLFFAAVQPRMRWITVALVLAVSMIALYLSHRPSRPLPDGEPIAVRTPEPPGQSSHINKQQVRTAATPRPITRRRKAHIGVIATNLSQELKKVAKVDSSMNGPVVNRGAGHSQPSSTPATLRVEIQTTDRNIRIIWLSGQRSGADGGAGSKGI